MVRQRNAYSSDESTEDQIEYFSDTEGVVEVFEFNYEDVFEFMWDVTRNNWIGPLMVSGVVVGFMAFMEIDMASQDGEGQYTFFLGPVAWVGAVAYFLLFLKPNIRDEVRCRHVCVTLDGIRYVQDKHKTKCRLDCQDVGKVTKTVPFDQLTDCDVEEPAGAEGPLCCLVNRRLTILNVDTASGSRGEGGVSGHELSLVGLRDPHSFKNLVWKMKRTGNALTHDKGSSAPVQQSMGAGGKAASMIARQNQLLEENIRLLERIAESTKK